MLRKRCASEALAAQVTGALAITAPAPDLSALSNLGAKVPSYATGYDEWPPRASWLGAQASADEGTSGNTSAAANAPQVTAPTDVGLRETIDRHYRESKSTTTNELVIRDQTGRAKFKKPSKSITVAPSGGG